ncbi:MAG: apolipoprotein N-acyltransferase [Candidatus Omnitrophica bacterium]|nr:apolipoprotein N-acyltransferase [Candidatus Omnitrophota bacterium]
MRKRILLSLLSGFLLILSFPNFLNLKGEYWFFAWIGFVPLLFALENLSKYKAFLVAYLSGIIFWLGIIYWLIHVSFLGMILLVIYLSFYFGAFGIFVPKYLKSKNFPSIKVASLWISLEYLRSKLFGGFGWANLGYSQYLNSPLIQIADLFGNWGVSFLIILVNSVIYSLLRYRFKKIKIKEYILVLSFLFFSLIYGFYKIFSFKKQSEYCQLKPAIVQPNIPQEEKWNPLNRDRIFSKHLKLSHLVRGENPHLIIWPEASLPVTLEEEESTYLKIIKNFVKENKTSLLLGAVMLKKDKYYNSAILVSTSESSIYNKLRLVPFGEYIPLKRIFGFLETVFPIGDFTAGKEWTVFSIPVKDCQVNFSVLICFEDLSPELSREFIRRGADFLVNITNDAWFMKTPSAYQHLSASVFRAVENKVYLVRSANTGVSGFISPLGVIDLLEDNKGRNIFIEGYKAKDIVIVRYGPSFYARYPDLIILFAMLTLFMDRFLKIFT